MARFTFGPETGHGGYQDSPADTGAIGVISTVPVDLKAGDISFTLSANIPGLILGDYIEVRPGTTEIRRVLAKEGLVVYLDYPLGYDHTAAKVKELTPVEVVTASTMGANTNIKYIPGVYESVQVPDLVPEFMPKYFLKSNNDRNWSYIYRGRQTFNGSLPNFILLNGFPLRFALGKVVTTSVATVHTHKISEEAELPSMTWNLQLQDSDKNSANNFIRRYVGGIVNRATISANEGEMLRMGWDDVQFLDLVHNQTKMVAPVDISRSSAALIQPGVAGGAATSDIVYPETEPYFFSNGELKFFGITFARVRNFRIEINNNIEARYYIRKQTADRRGPSEFLEQQREYTMTVALGMEDTQLDESVARTIWKELILEGNYKAYGTSGALTGFNMELIFTRGPNDYIKIVSPYKNDVATVASTSSVPATLSSKFEEQGCFFRRASHNVEQESPIQVDGEIIMRNLGVSIVDAIATYP